MRGIDSRRLTAVALLFILAVSTIGAGEIISVMRNVNAVGEYQGFRINPAYDSAAPGTPEDLAPVQAFEILRPQGRAVTLGRLYTSCTCVRLEAPKRSFGPNERVILQLRNVQPTPLNGQVYAIYIQITSPVNTTLRFDTFVQSNSAIMTNADRPDANSLAITTPSEITGSVTPPSIPNIEVIVPKATPDDVDADNGETDTSKAAEPDTADTGETEAPDTDTDKIETPEADTATDTKRGEEAASDQVEDAMDAFFAENDAASKQSDDASDTTAPSSADSMQPEIALIPPPVTDSDAGKEPAEGVAQPVAPPAAPALDVTGITPPTATSDAGRAPGNSMQTISLITIGVRDMARAIAFYEGLGWPRAARNKYDQTAFFQLNGQVLALYPIQDQLKEQNMGSAAPAPGGITLAIHVDNKSDVQKLYRTFMDAGGTSLKQPTEMPSGSMTCYVADPDGNPWEISWVPQFRVDKDGGLWLP